MDEKLKFIARYLEGEKIVPLCREFGVSRTTGYKLIERYQIDGTMCLGGIKQHPLSLRQSTAYCCGGFDFRLEKRVPQLESP